MSKTKQETSVTQDGGEWIDLSPVAAKKKAAEAKPKAKPKAKANKPEVQKSDYPERQA